MTDKPIDDGDIENSEMALFGHLFDYLHEACVKSTDNAVECHLANDTQEINAHAVKFLYDFIATEEGYEGDVWVTIVDRMVARIAVEGLEDEAGTYRECAS